MGARGRILVVWSSLKIQHVLESIDGIKWNSLQAILRLITVSFMNNPSLNGFYSVI